MRRKLSFRRFINYERRQLKVNRGAEYHSYAGTCYHSEQYAEKVLKEKLKELDIPFDRDHNLSNLLRKLASASGVDVDDPSFRKVESACSDLSLAYRKSRYLDIRWENSPITKRMAVRSVQQADEIVAWVRSL